MATRDELLGWIAETRRNQRILAFAVAASTALSVALWLWRKPIGGLGLLVTAFVALVGFWVTASHLNEWRAQLAKGTSRNQGV
jgi:hypothetical protein